VPGDDDICSDESTPRCDQASQDRRCDGKWWVCDDAIGPPWQSQIDCICDDNDDGPAGESCSQVGRSPGMELDGDDVGTAVEERFSESAGAGTNVNDKIARTDPGICDDLPRPAATEVMPPPTCPFRGHDAPS